MKNVVGISEIVLWTADKEQALHFYRDLLGLEVISPPTLPNVFLKAGEGNAGIPQMISLYPKPTRSKPGPPATSYTTWRWNCQKTPSMPSTRPWWPPVTSRAVAYTPSSQVAPCMLTTRTATKSSSFAAPHPLKHWGPIQSEAKSEPWINNNF